MEVKVSAQAAMREVMDLFSNYTADALKKIEKVQKTTGKELAAAISADSPRRDGDYKHYFQGWAVKSVKTVLSANISDIEAIVYNKDKPSLTHLLEFSHPAGADRHRVKASPHIENNAEKYTGIYIQRIISALEKG